MVHLGPDYPQRAAVDHYQARRALVFAAWPSPDMRETLKLELAYRILSRAAEGELFGEPGTHHPLLVDNGAEIW